MMKKLAIMVGGLVILLVAVVAIVFVSLDAVARAGIERGSTYALGVRTTLGSASIGILSGEFTMKDLDVTNPEGFDGDHFFQLDEGFVKVSLGSLRQDTVELPTLALTGVRMNLQKKGGQANYTVITENLKRLESGDTADEDGEPGKSFMIHEIVIKDINVTVDVLPIGGDLTRIEVPIEEVRLTEVGSATLTTAEVTSRVIKMVLAAVVRNGAKLPADLVNDLGGALRGLADLGDLDITQIAEIADIADIANAADQIGKEIENVGQAVDDALKGLGGLLGDE